MQIWQYVTSFSPLYFPKPSFQSYGIEHLLTFANLRQLGILVEQQPGETLTVMESKVGKLVNDKTAGNKKTKANTVLLLCHRLWCTVSIHLAHSLYL